MKYFFIEETILIIFNLYILIKTRIFYDDSMLSSINSNVYIIEHY